MKDLIYLSISQPQTVRISQQAQAVAGAGPGTSSDEKTAAALSAALAAVPSIDTERLISQAECVMNIRSVEWQGARFIMPWPVMHQFPRSSEGIGMGWMAFII